MSASAATLSSPSSSAAAAAGALLLSLASLLGVVFFGDALVSFPFRVISKPAIIANRGGGMIVCVWLSIREDAHVRTGNIGLDGVSISLEESLIQAGDVETTGFLSNTGFEHRDRQVGEESLLALEPSTEYVLRQGVGVNRDEALRFDVLADVREALD